MSLPRRCSALLAAGLTMTLALAACGSDTASTADAGGGDGGSDQLTVLAAFYPLQFAAQRVGGDRVQVDNLTAPGAEPHDLELTPQDVAGIADADLIVYLDGFQPAVDEAVGGEAQDTSFDAHDAAHLDLDAPEEEAGHAEGEEHAEGEAVDPHFWLDPLRLADVADALADRMAEVDPDGADTYSSNAADLRTDLEALDEEMTSGLADCTDTDLVTGHQAFGYLSERYGFTQVAISGLSPEDEPSAADLAEISDFVAANDVTTVYTETLVSPDVAEAVAAESGATTAVLDPLEGLTQDSADADYLSVMRANLEILQTGQGCG